MRQLFFISLVAFPLWRPKYSLTFLSRQKILFAGGKEQKHEMFASFIKKNIQIQNYSAKQIQTLKRERINVFFLTRRNTLK